MNTKKILFDLDCGEMGNQFTVEGIHQGDVNTSELVISLLNLGDEFTVSKNCYVRIYGVKPDGTKLCNECEIDEQGDIHYVLKEQDTTASGIVNYQLIISCETEGEVQVLATPCFDCYVEPKVVNETYVLLIAKPTDWETAYSKYFKLDDRGYIPVESVNDWAEGEIYFCDGFVESSDQLDVLTNLIHKVQKLSTEDGMVEDLEINAEGELVLKFSNGNEKILGTVKGKDGNYITVIDITESTEDNGSNVVTFSNGVKLTVKNGSKGSKGEKGDKGDTGADGADGYTPVKGTDYFTEDDKTEMINAVKDTCIAKNQGSANVGKILVVGTDGNLVLTDMPEGGTSGDVTGILDKSNNILLSGNLADGTYTLKYENEDGSYTDIGSLVVGEIKPAYTNLAVPDATNTTDWSIWCNDARFGSDGTYRQQTGTSVSNYIPCDTSVGEYRTVRVKGMTDVRFVMYDSNKAYRAYCQNGVNENAVFVTIDGDYTEVHIRYSNVEFIRAEGVLSGTVNDVIITVDEKIV